ncbi:hypothetical protein EN991_37315, partial [Mesorhizobium sp. M7A.F.Ca.US.005.03.2.1]
SRPRRRVSRPRRRVSRPRRRVSRPRRRVSRPQSSSLWFVRGYGRALNATLKRLGSCRHSSRGGFHVAICSDRRAGLVVRTRFRQ